MTQQIKTIDLNEAQAVINAAVNKSIEISVPVFATVVNSVGQTVASARVDGTNFFAERIANGKALTAVGMGAPTKLWEDVSETNPAFAGGITSVRDFVPFAGGAPIHSDDVLIGAIGISGGTSEQDVVIAEAAVAALKK